MSATTTITVNELKQWLSGVEDMQEPDWYPNQTQWKKIRDKIFCLEASAAGIPVQYAHSNNRAWEDQPGQIRLSNPDNAAAHYTAAPGGLDVPLNNAPVVIPQGVPMVAAEGALVSTPSIDTSGGRAYSSAFA